MAVLARKITRAKWEQKPQLGVGEIAADAVTADLRTEGNALSVWKCPTRNATDLREAILALAAAAQRPDKFEIAFVEEEQLAALGLTGRSTPGSTPVSSVRDLHVDIEGLDLDRLGRVARLIAEALHRDQYLRLTKAEVVQVLVDAVRGNRLQTADLNGEMRQTVAYHLARQ